MVQFPKIIQGGMGVGVSNWRLAQAVSRLGQLGVVSGTALDSGVCAPARGRRSGRPHAPRTGCLSLSRRWRAGIWQEYFIAGGKAEDAPYPSIPMHQHRDPRKLIEALHGSQFC